jgi:uncharacterized phiE125 gp8 family phage protein
VIYSIKETTATTLDLSLIPLGVAKNFLRVTGEESHEDARIIDLIKSCRQEVENDINRVILSATWTHRMDSFPIGNIVLVKTPVQSVTSVAYIDTDGNSQNLVENTNYQVDIHTGRIGLVTGQSWPATKTNTYNAVVITYVAGYTVATCPPGLKNGILYKLWEAYHGDPMSSLIETSVGFYRNPIF